METVSSLWFVSKPSEPLPCPEWIGYISTDTPGWMLWDNPVGYLRTQLAQSSQLFYFEHEPAKQPMITTEQIYSTGIRSFQSGKFRPRLQELLTQTEGPSSTLRLFVVNMLRRATGCLLC